MGGKEYIEELRTNLPDSMSQFIHRRGREVQTGLFKGRGCWSDCDIMTLFSISECWMVIPLLGIFFYLFLHERELLLHSSPPKFLGALGFHKGILELNSRSLYSTLRAFINPTLGLTVHQAIPPLCKIGGV